MENAITNHLERTGLNAFQLAQKMGVAPSTVTRHMEGSRVRMSLAMAKLYHNAGIPWEELLSMVPDKTEESTSEAGA